MYDNNDFYGNGGYDRDQNDYKGYSPYEPPSGGKKKKGGKGWLYALLIVLAVVVVATVSIGIYAAVTGSPEKDTLEWSEPEDSTAEPEDNADSSETLANEGTSDKYSLTPSDSAAGEMSPQQVSEKLIPSVVCIQNYQKVVYENRGFGFGQNSGVSLPTTEDIELYGEGSGIVITEDGYIATNAHVVSDADLLKVVMSTGDIYEAKLVGIDSDTDLAVIKVEASGLTKAELGDSDSLSVGQYVMAVGNPGGLEFSSSVTLGIVSAVDRPLALNSTGYTMSTIQTDAAINPGNSGGALVNLKGQVVGICSAKYVASGYEGLGFAITINEALPIVKDLMDYGSVQNRSMLGINGIMLDELTAKYYDLKEGFYVYSVSNPNAGGLQGGDVITAVNGTSVTADVNIKDVIKGFAPGTTISIEYFRSSDGKTYTGEMTLVDYTTAD